MIDDPWFDQYAQDPNAGQAPTSVAAPGTPPPTGGVAGGQNTGTPTPAGGGDPNAFRDAWFNSPYPKTVDGLKQFVAANPQFGATITGSKGSKVLIGGQAFQAVRSAGLGGGIGPAWDPLGAEGAGGGGSGSALAGLGYSFGSSMAPWTKEFSAPTADQALATPGFQFALDEANRMGQNSAAAKGTLLNGRFQQALAGSNIQNALQGYGDVYNRGMNEYLLGRENFYNNQDRPFNKNVTLANLGAPK